jgi:putative ABC transport system substrate-binding protein
VLHVDRYWPFTPRRQLKEAAPAIKRVALLRDAKTGAGIGQWGASEAFAGSFGFELHPINLSTPDEIERSIDVFAQDGDAAAGMIVTNSGPSVVHRELVIGLAAPHRLPTVYPQRLFATSEDLISYGSDPIDSYRRAVSYVDRAHPQGGQANGSSGSKSDQIRTSDQSRNRRHLA